MLNRLDDVDSAVRFGAINRFSSFDFDAEIGELVRSRVILDT